MTFLKAVAPLLLATVAVASEATTLVTFHDPALNSSTPLFVRDVVTNKLDGGWSGLGLTLEAPSLLAGTVYSNATFSMSELTLTPVFAGVYSAGPGVIDFKDSASNSLITIFFNGGLLTNSGIGASVFSGNIVSVGGPALLGPVANTEFSFSFANTSQTGNLVSSTASFTSSATPVPEPAGLLVFGLGVSACIRRSRRK